MPSPSGRSVRPPADPFAPPSAPFPGAPFPPGPGGAPFPAPPGMGGAPFPSPSGRPGPGASLPPGAHRPSVPADPFAAAQPVAPAREVRLVFDDKDVADAEVGRKSGLKFIIGALVAAMVGVLLGWFVGSTWRERKLYDVALHDAKEMYGSVNTASATVERAQKLIDQAVKAAAPGAGKSIEIDAQAIKDLRALPKPFPADVFSRKHYRALEPATVDQLFIYYNTTNLLWGKLETIAGRALSKGGQEGLALSAKAANDVASLDLGCVPFKDGNAFGCGVVAVARGEGGKVTVVTRQGSFEKQPFTGQDLAAKASDYVIMIDKARSNEILASATGQFQSFARDLMEAKTLADQAVSAQGQLLQKLGEVAKLEKLY